MAHGKSRHKLEREMREAQAEQERRDEPARLRAEREAKLTVAFWKLRILRGSPLWFYPTIRAAVTAGRPFLTCVCFGCPVQGCVDLRKLRRHPEASLQSLIPMMSCKRCSPNVPFAKLTGLWRRRRCTMMLASDELVRTPA
jgi:hypothetical protein